MSLIGDPTNPFASYTATTDTLVPNSYSLGQAITTPDHRDREIESLRNCLHEAYSEIGRLHETIRGMQAFGQFSGKLAAQKQP